MPNFLILLVFSFKLSFVGAGLATEFRPHEKLNDGILACDHGRKWTNTNEAVCAHRTLPCGTRLLIINLKTNLSTMCTVLDRGPYGAVYNKVWVTKIHRRDPGKWRGIIDMGPAVSKAIQLGGMGRIEVYKIE